MNLREFFRANEDYWYSRLMKIIPINFAYAFMKVWVVLMIILVICMVYPWPNHDYYKSGIIGEIEKVEREPKNWNVKIGSSWYFVRTPGIDFIEVGRKIVKQPDSWVFTIYDDSGMIVYQDSLKDVAFELMKNKKY